MPPAGTETGSERGPGGLKGSGFPSIRFQVPRENARPIPESGPGETLFPRPPPTANISNNKIPSPSSQEKKRAQFLIPHAVFSRDTSSSTRGFGRLSSGDEQKLQGLFWGYPPSTLQNYDPGLAQVMEEEGQEGCRGLRNGQAPPSSPTRREGGLLTRVLSSIS